MTVSVYKNDLPPDLDFGGALAIDTETLGLNPHRDRLCVVSFPRVMETRISYSSRKGATMLQISRELLTNPQVLKIFHFGRFDIAVLQHYLGVTTRPAYCTKIAAKLVRTFTDRHGLKDLCRELLGVEISKQQQTSDSGPGCADARTAELCGFGCSPSSRAKEQTRHTP